MVYAVLKQAGYRVGLYTSPHLVDFRERIIVNDVPISENAFTMWVERLEGQVAEHDASFFEATTAIAFADFAARGTEIAVVEVGLGGRLDSTNVITPLVTAVTNIGREHVEYLGTSLEGIAREKAGIAKAQIPFVIGERDTRLVTVLKDEAARAGARVLVVPPDREYSGTLALQGRHQRRNAALAETIVAELGDTFDVSSQAVSNGLAAAWIPARFDRRGRWVFDAAHNPMAIENLVEHVRTLDLDRPVHALFGAMADKDWAAMVGTLRTAVDEVWVTIPLSAPRERRPQTALLHEVRTDGVTVDPDLDSALDGVQRHAKTVLVTGSFFTVGDVMSRLPGFAPLG